MAGKFAGVIDLKIFSISLFKVVDYDKVEVRLEFIVAESNSFEL